MSQGFDFDAIISGDVEALQKFVSTVSLARLQVSFN